MPISNDRRSSKNNNNNNNSAKEKQPSGETSCEGSTRIQNDENNNIILDMNKTSEDVGGISFDANHPTNSQKQPLSSLRRRSRALVPTIISPRTRGNAIAQILASPGDFLHNEHNIHDDNIIAGTVGNQDEEVLVKSNSSASKRNKFISPSKRSTAEAALHLIAQRRKSVRNTSDEMNSTAGGRSKLSVASTSKDAASLLTTPGGRRRKRKAACEAQSKVRDICEMEDFDHLDDLLRDSEKIPQNESSLLPRISSDQGRKKRTRREWSAGASVSDLVVVADRCTSLSSPTSEKKHKFDVSRIPIVTAKNNVTSPTALFVPKGKVEERWFRNFQKWKYNSLSSPLSKTNPSTEGMTTSATSLQTTTSPPPKLWVQEQRTQYKRWKQDKKSQLTKERIELLENAGFCWDVVQQKKKGGDSTAPGRSKMRNTTDEIKSRGNRDNSEDHHRKPEGDRQVVRKERKSSRRSAETQFNLDLREGSNSTKVDSIKLTKGNSIGPALERQTRKETLQSLEKRQSLPNPYRPLVKSLFSANNADDDKNKSLNRTMSEPKQKRRGRHSMSALESLPVSTDTMSPSDAGMGNAVTKRSKSLFDHKEIDLVISKSQKQRERKKMNRPKVGQNPQEEQETNNEEPTKTSHYDDVPMVQCDDVLPSLESPLLVATRLTNSSLSTNDALNRPNNAPIVNTPDPLCVRKLMLSCLSDESLSVVNGVNSTDRNSFTALANKKGGKSSLDVLEEATCEDSQSVGRASQMDDESTRPAGVVIDQILTVNTAQLDETPRSSTNESGNSLSPSTSYDVEDNVTTSWDPDNDLNSIPQTTNEDSNHATDPPVSFSPSSRSKLPASNIDQIQTLIDPKTQTRIQCEIGTQTADPSIQVFESQLVENLNRTQSNLPSAIDQVNDANKDKSFVRRTSLLSEQSLNQIEPYSAINVNHQIPEAVLATYLSRILASHKSGSHNRGSVLIAGEPNVAMIVSSKHTDVMTNQDQLQLKKKIVAQRMREIEDNLKMINSSSIPYVGIDQERGKSREEEFLYRSGSSHRRLHSSSKYYEASDEEYDDEFRPPSPRRKRRTSEHLESEEMFNEQSSNRRSKARETSLQRDRARSDRYASDNRAYRHRISHRDDRYHSDCSVSSSGSFSGMRDDGRYQIHRSTKRKSGRSTNPSIKSDTSPLSKESYSRRKEKRQHRVSVLETASPITPSIANDDSGKGGIPRPKRSLAGDMGSGQSANSKEVIAKPSMEHQRSEIANTGMSPITSNNESCEQNVNISSGAYGERSKVPLFRFLRGESSSDDESWDFDGPMILPPPPL